jgi:hypothetical protein
MHEKPPNDPIQKEIERLDLSVHDLSYEELKELFQLSKEGFLKSSPFLFNCGLKNSGCRCWENPAEIERNQRFTLQELNALYANKAKELIQKGRAHERA